MQTRAGRRRAAEHATALPPPGWPLLQLPAPAQRAVLAHLDAVEPDRACGQLRLACKSAKQLVDEATMSLRVLALLRISPADLSGVRSRFPSLTRLCAHGYDIGSSSGEQCTSEAEAIGLLTGPEPWLAIQDLHLMHVPDAALALAISRCPRVTSCSLMCSESSGPSEQAMCALARCPSLASLSFDAGEPNAVGIAALCSITSLTSLQYHYGVGDSPAIDAAWDMRGMVALQSVSVLRSWTLEDTYPYDSDDGEDEYLEQLQAQLEEWDEQVYGAMQLPASLCTLRLDSMPAPVLALPCLVSLTLDRCTATDEVLARLAAGCPALTQLCLYTLDITAAAHEAPLAALSSLEVTDCEDAAAGVRLAGAFPALCSLTFKGEAYFDEPEVFFVGASRLGSIGCGRRDVRSDVFLEACMFGPLAELQQLSTMQLNAAPEHLEGVQMLTQLTGLVWTVGANQSLNVLAEMQAAFATYNAPPGLRHATVAFLHDAAEYDPVHTFKAVVSIADAIVSWLARAPALEHVVWEHQKNGAGTMTAAWLAALTVSNSIRHISIDSKGAYNPVPKSLLSMARWVSRRRQVHVEIQGMAY